MDVEILYFFHSEMMNRVHYIRCVEVQNHDIDTYTIKKYKKSKDTLLIKLEWKQSMKIQIFHNF